MILEVKNLIKEFGSFRAVDRINFSVPRGKVIGLLGPNGAGKTTTIQMLIGITSITSGSIFYFGKDFFKYKQESLQRINYVSSFNTLQGTMSPWENLVVFAHLYNVKNYKKKIYELIEYFDAGDFLHKRYWDLSTGQRTRVNIIKSLLNDPDLILMDEPTASLDPDVADKTLAHIETLIQEKNLSMVFTSHDMSEVARICDEVIFLDHGKIVAQDTPEVLARESGNVRLEVTFNDQKGKIEKYAMNKKRRVTFLNEKTVIIELKETEISQTIADLHNMRIVILDIEVKKPTLDDVFLQIARRREYVT